MVLFRTKIRFQFVLSHFFFFWFIDCSLHHFFCSKVYGWDTFNNTYDTDESDGRSYISAISEIITDPTLNCTGNAKNTMGEARMVSNSHSHCRLSSWMPLPLLRCMLGLVCASVLRSSTRSTVGF